MTPARRLIAAVPLAVLAVLTLGGVAGAQSLGSDHPLVVLTGGADVRPAQTYTDVLVFDGDVTIEGQVTGRVLAFNGDVTVTGRVGGDLAAANGRVTVSGDGHVGGDVTSSEPPSIARGSVDGRVSSGGAEPGGGHLNDLGRFGRIAIWLAATVGSFLIGLVLTTALPRGADAIVHAALRRVGPSIGWGFAAAIGLPVLGGVLIVTLVGGLLGLGIWLALLLVYSIAYAAGALALGRILLKPPRPRFLAFLLAWVILRVAALIPGVGGLLLVAMTVWGIGALVVASFTAGRGARAVAPPAPASASTPAVPPPPPMPAMP